MTEIDDTELERRAKISAARRARLGASNGDGSAARKAKLQKADAFAATMRPIMLAIAAQMEVVNFTAIANVLNQQNYKAARGGPWSAKQVERILDKIPTN